MRASTLAVLTLPPLLWASNAIVGRMAAGAIPPFTLNFLRWALALVIDSTRAPETLRQQLLKIYDVEELSFSAVQELTRDRRHQDRAA